MHLTEVGKAVRLRRKTIGLTQQRLARLSNLSRATINQLENGTLEDIGVAKLSRLLDVLGMGLDTSQKKPGRHALRAVARTASVSYRNVMHEAVLVDALVTGSVPTAYEAHISTLIDEAPVSLIARMVEEVAVRAKVPAKDVWRGLLKIAEDFHSPRTTWR